MEKQGEWRNSVAGAAICVGVGVASEVRDLTWQAQSVYQAGGSKSDTDDARGW
ncbi:hypothetical protein [Streptomyces prunicolor]|uniref:Uncharacterized protein n=1 Tax=Streptomyces prunicolor TaxID=67348 RepID=A0ABU4F9W3_9ACTN|nr:hypothetical protein [Streptomyces prunicolor]MDV7216771.1 hypothetical protein [Streptomyces prunicolor]